ncbi:MAG: hypothetical protein HOP33_06370 [Verrucomicrobia bacterium]|nr:hypothetical protein [Verrucomicrobiota bacterium]
MPLLINLRHLDTRDQKLEGELSVVDLEFDDRDEMVLAHQPLCHKLEVQKLDDSLLVRGSLRLVLDCQCVRCLKPFEFTVKLDEWTCLVPLEGDDKAPIVSDSVDLTPYLREDILLSFPQHPLCKPGCGGLKKPDTEKKKTNGKDGTDEVPSPWAELDKLKPKN